MCRVLKHISKSVKKSTVFSKVTNAFYPHWTEILPNCSIVCPFLIWGYFEISNSNPMTRADVSKLPHLHAFSWQFSALNFTWELLFPDPFCHLSFPRDIILLDYLGCSSRVYIHIDFFDQAFVLNRSTYQTTEITGLGWNLATQYQFSARIVTWVIWNLVILNSNCLTKYFYSEKKVHNTHLRSKSEDS